jgi:peptidoglycan/LPS O-acetylase OafA/YrhL
MTAEAGAPPRGDRSDAIDILKALAIVAVLVQHTVPGHALADVGRNLWIRPAVPIFFILLGVNLAGSLLRHGGPETRASLVDYYRRRLDRILVPVLVAAAFCYVIAAARGDLHPVASWGIGGFPTDPPGNYFVPAFIGMVLLFPALLWAYRRAPVATVVGAIAVDLAVETALVKGTHVGARLAAGDAPFWFPSFPLRYLGATAVGVWIASDRGLLSRRNLWLVALAIPSAVFLWALDAGHAPISWYPNSYEKAMSVLAVPWAAVLVMAAMALLPSTATGRVGRSLVGIGRASFHVYLAQLVWIGAVTGNHRGTEPALVNIPVSVLLGLVFYRLVPGSFGWLEPRARRPAAGATGSSPE